MGFCITWLSGKHGKKEFELTAGAGCGNPLMGFTYGDKRYSCDVRKLIPQLIETIDETKRTKVQKD